VSRRGHPPRDVGPLTFAPPCPQVLEAIDPATCPLPSPHAQPPPPTPPPPHPPTPPPPHPQVLEAIDTTKYPLPEPYPYKEAAAFFAEPEVTKAADIPPLKWAAPDVEGLVQFLVGA
jgi:hypothetical protein